MENTSLVSVLSLLLVSSVLPVHCSDEVSFVTYRGGQYTVHSGRPLSENWIAQGKFTNTINSTGWSYLWIRTNPAENDTIQAYSAGLLEASLTASLMAMSGQNTWTDFCHNSTSEHCLKLIKFMQTNLDWMLEQVADNADRDPYWHMVNMFLMQLKGIQDGYYARDMEMELSDIYWLQFSAELDDISTALGLPLKRYLRGGSCSAMVKLLAGNKDLYVAHDTWNIYSTMLRTLKSFDFGYHILPNSKFIIPGGRMSFSSYPGMLASMDDYYLLSSGMASLETTLQNNNPKIAKKSTVPKGCLLEIIRVMVANRIATNGQQWAKIFAAYNSGTYNNQWMVVNYNLFEANQPLPDRGLLMVLEQMPGYIMFRDMTPLLKKQGYWGSYNTPYFPEIVKLSGQQDLINKYGDLFSYENAPRGKIMRRDQVKVTDMKSMMKLMRYNDFKNDPLSKCNCTPAGNAELSISSRSDLNPANGTYPVKDLSHRPHGGTDMKLTNSSMAKRLSFVAISGPTYDQVPAFQWSKSDFNEKVPHIGHPDLFKFGPYIFGENITQYY